MRLIRFRRLGRKPYLMGDVVVSRWEIAFSEEHLLEKLNGEMAEVIMPARSWPVRLWRRFFPLRAIEMQVEA